MQNIWKIYPGMFDANSWNMKVEAIQHCIRNILIDARATVIYTGIGFESVRVLAWDSACFLSILITKLKIF